jgi:hypothetical protein
MALKGKQIRRAIEATGLKLGPGPRIELLIVGGAAGLLTGLFRPERTTTDVDILNIVPSRENDSLYDAAANVAKEMELPADWLNGDAGLYREALPPTWKRRRIRIGRFGRLTVHAAGRMDLITMKFYAGRPQDIQDLVDLVPTLSERTFARRHIAQLPGDGRVQRTLHRIDQWQQ